MKDMIIPGDLFIKNKEIGINKSKESVKEA
jgi:hypothetical protein